MAVVAKADIVSQNTIKPSSPTPSHLQHFKLSLLDQLAPPFYVPIVLFYSPPDHDFSKISDKLKASLSQVLTLYYPFCGRSKGNKSNAYVDCNDEGALYLEARTSLTLSDFLQSNNHNPQPSEIKMFLPLDPYNPQLENEEYPFIMEVQVTEFSCGSVAIGVCISHKVCDGATIASFLQAWSEKAVADGNDFCNSPPNMDASFLFPARDIEMNIASGMIREKNISTRRFLFSGKSLSELKDKLVSGGCNCEPTRVEAVTALIWKSAMKVAGGAHQSMVSHAINIRSRMAPPLPENSVGNLWQQAISALVGREVELRDLAEVVRKTIKRMDREYVRKLQGGSSEGVGEIVKSLKEVMYLVGEEGVPCYSFSSWIRFGLYETNFGWGKPTWTCTIGVPIKNVIILMPTKYGDGSIEAWVTLDDLHMPQFQHCPELLQFASFDL
ncbi:stemmadenine O-acetyltransferase-like [Prosopis cineraria]|uniref:stemmadenine O-acetyltransferase-like n=1 Tax=Prosopis cineraria TaxID=364024 RepID=UPI00241095D1|nr:stemmadenine O-acetyltransferase-like [Prosopis cineraria]